MTPRAAVRLIVGGLLLSLGLFAVVAEAQYVGGGSIGAAGGGGGGSGAASSLQDAVDGIVNILDIGGASRGEIVTRNGNTEVYLKNTGLNTGIFKADGTSSVAGSTTNVGAGSAAYTVSDSINVSTGGTAPLFRFFGEGVFQPVPGSALAISGTPDTTRDPVTAGSSCRFSAASPGQTWTWPESNGVTGMGICCTNTGANSVVVNDSAGVFEGTGPTVGQWDTICAEYVTDRWVQRSFMDN